MKIYAIKRNNTASLSKLLSEHDIQERKVFRLHCICIRSDEEEILLRLSDTFEGILDIDEYLEQYLLEHDGLINRAISEPNLNLPMDTPEFIKSIQNRKAEQENRVQEMKDFFNRINSGD
jgi:hypothetical protein